MDCRRDPAAVTREAPVLYGGSGRPRASTRQRHRAPYDPVINHCGRSPALLERRQQFDFRFFVPPQVMRAVFPQHPHQLVRRHPTHRRLAEPAIGHPGQAHRPRSAAGTAETAAPTIPKARQPPSPIAPCAPSGSKHSEISAFCGSYSHVVRFIEHLPCGGSKTGQLVCYITRTTHLLTTRANPGAVGSTSSCPVFVAHHLSASR